MLIEAIAFHKLIDKKLLIYSKWAIFQTIRQSYSIALLQDNVSRTNRPQSIELNLHIGNDVAIAMNFRLQY